MAKIKMSPFDSLFRLLTRPLIALLYCALIALLILYWDKPLSHYFYYADMRAHLPFLSYVTRIGLGVLYLPCFILLLIFFRFIRKNPKYESQLWFLLCCLVIPTLVCIGLKIILGRARPNMYLQGEGHYYGFYGFETDAHFWSLPSGHTTTIMGVVLGFGILFPRYFYPLLVLGFSVAISRVLLTHHYLSDVFFTFYLTVIEIGFLLYVLRRNSWLAPAWEDRV